MSLYELEGMTRMLAKGNKAASRTMSDEEFDAALQGVRDLGLPDVVV